MPAKTPTAIRNYWFGKAYRDMVDTISDAHKRNMTAASAYWSKTGGPGDEIKSWVYSIFFGISSAAVLCFGTIVWLALVPFHISIVILFGTVVMACFLCVAFAERCYSIYKGWTTICKHCGDKVALPEFQCPGCRAWHPELKPSSYGIFGHTCKCGQKLSCNFLGDRHRLIARCPHCLREMDAATETRSMTTVIPILGPPACGKTGLMTAIMETMHTKIAPRFKLSASFTDPESNRFFEDEKRHIEATGSTRKTTNEKPPAFNALFESVAGNQRHQLYLFDAAGEVFRNSDKLAAHHQFKHITGGIIVIDPFSLPLLKQKFGEKLAKAGLGVAFSQDEAIDALDRFLIGMERHFGLKPEKLISKPFAVVVTKTDLAKLDQKLTPITGTGLENSSQHIRQTLQKWGGKALVNLLDTRFGDVRYFAVAPIKLTKKEKGYSGKLVCRGMESPIAWLLHTAKDPIAQSDSHLV